MTKRELHLIDIGFSLRTERMFYENKITTLQQLLELSAGNLRRKDCFTPSVLQDIRKKLSFHNLSLYGDVLITTPAQVILAHDIPDMLEGICESVRKLNEVLTETKHQIKDLEEKLSTLIAAEQYKKG